jgi:hypothetical protein
MILRMFFEFFFSFILLKINPIIKEINPSLKMMSTISIEIIISNNIGMVIPFYVLIQYLNDGD